MKEVAERAGVSVMSVSRALRNERGISSHTRSKILKIAQELGYQPNPLVGALMASLRGSRPKESAETIAFITSHQTPQGWRNSPTFDEFFQGAHSRAEELGFRLEEFWLNKASMPGLRLSEILRARGIRGVILCPQPLPGQPIELRWSEFAVVSLGYSMPNPQVHRATSHQLHIVRLALAELAKRGYRRIGLAVHSHFDSRVDYNWTSGFLGYQYQIPKEDRVPPLIWPKFDQKSIAAWIRRHRPDAIVGAVPLECFRAIGVSIPEQIGFAYLDYHPSKGNVAGVDQNSRAVGGAATDLVAEQLYHNQFGLPRMPKVVMIEGRWRNGRTVRPERQRAESRIRRRMIAH